MENRANRNGYKPLGPLKNAFSKERQMKQFLMTALISIVATMVFAAGTPETGPDKMVEQTAETSEFQAPERQTPFQLKINSLMEEEKADIAALEVEMGNASSEEVALQVLKQIEQRKLETELSLLQYQKDEAEKQGNTELVNKISACMEQTRSPRPVGTPQNRSTPTQR